LVLYDGELKREPEVLAEPVEPEPAHGGRSDRFMLMPAPCAAPFTGALLERPKPCGALPRSVTLPCASHVRVPFVEWFCDAPLVVAFNVARLLIPPFADGGLVCERPFVGRFCNAPLVVAFNVARLLIPPLADGGLFCDSWFWRGDIPELTRMLLAGALPVRPADNPVVFMVWTGMCEAAEAGAVRAITERFCIEDGGVVT
jgi:hypothetical protein